MPDLGAVAESEESAGGEHRFRTLWEISELSAADFADEVAHFYNLPRATLPDLLAARPCSSSFPADSSAR